MTFIFFQFGWQIGLIANQNIINKGYTGNPVAMFQFTVALNIVLPAAEIPHEIAPVHEVDLIIEEKAKILTKGGHHITFFLPTEIIGYFTAVPHIVGSVIRYVRFVAAVHTGEKHHKPTVHFIITLVSRNNVFVLFSRISFGFWRINGCFVGNWYAGISLNIEFEGCTEYCTVKERSVAVLFTVEV